MARKLPRKDAVIVGLGWTGSILAHELTDAGLDVVAVERGPWRDTATDFAISYGQDEWRYRLQHELFLRPAQTTVTFRNNAGQTALPVRNWGAFMLGNGVGGGGTGTPRRFAFCQATSCCARTWCSATAKAFCRRT
jgi:gluconate 2-dehydrogenase alpha chain